MKSYTIHNFITKDLSTSPGKVWKARDAHHPYKPQPRAEIFSDILPLLFKNTPKDINNSTVEGQVSIKNPSRYFDHWLTSDLSVALVLFSAGLPRAFSASQVLSKLYPAYNQAN
jgi:hypothetical protein